MIEYYKMAFQKYAQFSGRSTRSEYWWFVLCNSLIMMALYAFTIASISMETTLLMVVSSILLAVYMLGAFLPAVGVLVRRLHDVGKSGWFYFIALIPIVGSFILLYFLIKESEPNTNQWGTAPGHSSSNGLKDVLVDYDKDIV